MSMEPMQTVGQVRDRFLVKRIVAAAQDEGDKYPPVAMFGSPGIGKTRVTENLDQLPQVQEQGIEVEVHKLHLVMENPVTIEGLKWISEDGRTLNARPNWLPEDDGRAHVVFYDDFNAAPRANQGAIYTALTNWAIGMHQMPANTVQVLAGNLPDDKAIVNAVSSALTNRCYVTGVYADPMEWVDWATDQGFPDMHTAFVARFKNEVLMASQPKENKPWPSPRAHENLFREVQDEVGMLGAEEAYAPYGDTHVIEGYLGPDIAQKFKTFLEYEHVLDLVDEVEDGSLPGDDRRVNELTTDERYVLGVGAVNALDPKALIPWLLDWQVDTDCAAFMSKLAQRQDREATVQAILENKQRVHQEWSFAADMEGF